MSKCVYLRDHAHDRSVLIAQRLKRTKSAAALARECGLDERTVRNWLANPSTMKLEGALRLMEAAGIGGLEMADLLGGIT